MSYTRRVRSLIFLDAGQQEQTVETLLGLFNSHTTPPLVFPNLHTIQWFDERQDMLPCLLRCLSPTVTVLSLNLGYKSWFRWSSTGIQGMATIMDSLARKTPSMDQFWCNVPPAFDAATEMFSELICGWTRLTNVGMPIPVNSRTLLHLASLSLRKLYITIPSAWGPAETAHSVSAWFPESLENLCISGPTFSSCARFMARLHAAPLSVNVRSEAPCRAHEVRELTKMLSTQLSHQRLQELCIQMAEPDNKGVPHLLELKDIEPLSRFTQLKVLNLNELYPGNLRDGDIHHLASAWPHLVRLFFGTRWESPVRPCVSVAGLQSVLTQCPMLETLCLPVNFHFSPDMIISAEQPYSGVVHTSLRHLNVGCGSCNEPKSTAALLSAMLPSMYLSYWKEYSEDEGETPLTDEESSRIAAWVEVQRLLGYDLDLDDI
ncbi:hypothetical protein HYDPIDRAFT_29576 [Hydnomerulius pinastri MD-312]|uniref:F-box domain-containing protein n=1 Tax=Hydnomerulius pinastri MD-312 TaxID=994086 RepID=A0A0C9VCI2_9AGAM|nr:hypothetical protein HYDPIDRAFT_29576 [Hydnomerulius pinastri MD-312]